MIFLTVSWDRSISAWGLLGGSNGRPRVSWKGGIAWESSSMPHPRPNLGRFWPILGLLGGTQKSRRMRGIPWAKNYAISRCNVRDPKDGFSGEKSIPGSNVALKSLPHLRPIWAILDLIWQFITVIWGDGGQNDHRSRRCVSISFSVYHKTMVPD